MKVVFNKERLDAIFQPFDRTDAPGLVLGIAHDGQPLYRRGCGLASLDLPLALTPSTRLRIGSTSKHFTALAVILLAEDGKLDLDASIRSVLPEMPDWAQPITFWHLISHTSGMRCSLDLLTLTAGIMANPLPHEEQVRLLMGLQSTNFAPGEDWNYCNGGYVLLTKVIERLSDDSYADFLARRILHPAGLFDTQARALDTDFLPRSASLHLAQPDGTYRRGIFGPDIGGEGNLVSTVDDMLRWLRVMSRRAIGTEATWERMSRTAKVRGEDTGYAAGLVHSRWRGLELVFHTGHVLGGSSQMLTAPALGLDVVALANSSAVDPVGLTLKAIEAIVDGLEPEEDVPGSLPCGDYLSPTTGRLVSIVEKDGKTCLELEPAIMPLRFRRDGTAWVPANMMKGAFLRSSGDDLEWREFETVDRLRRISPDHGGSELVGSYVSPETGSEATVEGQTLRIRSRHGEVKYRLRARSSKVWTVLSDEGWVGSIEWRDEAFLLSSLRTRRLRFERCENG